MSVEESEWLFLRSPVLSGMFCPFVDTNPPVETIIFMDGLLVYLFGKLMETSFDTNPC